MYYHKAQHNNLFNFDQIDDETIFKIIDNIQPKTSCGFNGISSRLVQLLKLALIKSLTLITNQILTTDIFPEFAALKLTDIIMTQVDNNEIPINIFVDLSKAFDTLDNTKLLGKLAYYGVKGVALGLVRNYLTYRKQYVEIEDVKSSMLNISTGVPKARF